MKGLQLLTAGLAVSLLAGCAATNVENMEKSDSQYYRAAGASQQMKISGTLDASFNYFALNRPDPVLTVFVDEQKALQGTLSPSYTGEVTGRHNGMNVDSVCSSEQKTRDWVEVRCLVFVDNERAATLTF